MQRSFVKKVSRVLSVITLMCIANIQPVIISQHVSAQNLVSAARVTSLGETIGPAEGSVVVDYTTKPTVDANGVVFVPILETFQKMGVEVNYNSSAKTYAGLHNNGNFEIVVGNSYVEIDWVDVEMPAASKTVSGVDMIPLVIFEDIFKTESSYYDPSTGKVHMVEPGEVTVTDGFDPSDVIANLSGTSMISGLYPIYVYQNANPSGTFTAHFTDSNTTMILRCTANEYGDCSGGQAIKSVSGSYYKGEVGLIAFEARATELPPDKSSASVLTYFERSVGDYNKAASEQIVVPAVWKKFYIPVYSESYDVTPANGGRLIFKIAEPTTVEIRDFSFVNYENQITIEEFNPEEAQGYKGIEDDALWRKEAYKRIEKYRKEDVTVTVKDENGNPVPNAKIDFNQTESEFIFGVSLCSNEVLDLDQRTDAGGEILSEMIDTSFNGGVCGLEMKTAYMVADDGDLGIRMVNEFFSRGKRMRGHAVYWDGPALDSIDDYKTKTYQQMYDEIMERVRPTVYLFRDKLAQWDVLNEPTASNYLRTTFDTTRLYSDIFKETKRHDKTSKLYVNETGIEGRQSEHDANGYIPTLINVVKSMQREGAEIDGIGVQAHCKTLLYPQGFYHQLDDLAAVVDEVAVTEYDFLFTDSNYEFADEHLRDTLLATFSHPQASAFMIWGVEDSMHWRNTGPFYDRQWNERPAKAVWDNMVNNEFKTNETVYTDEDGKATVRGFHGDYVVSCTTSDADGSTDFTIVKDGDNEIVFTINDTVVNATRVTNKPAGNIEPITYVDSAQAFEEYKAANGPEYSTVYLDTRFKNIENTTDVLNGKTPSTITGYNEGKKWGSPDGISGLVAGGDPISVYLTPTVAKYADLRHKVVITDAYDGVDTYVDIMFDTLQATAEDTVITELLYDNGKIETNLGNIVYSDGSYLVETLDGEVIPLETNTQYTLKITDLLQGGLRYEVMLKDGTIVDTCLDTSNISLESIDEIVCRITSDAAMNQNVMKLHALRVAAEKAGEILEFSATDYRKNLIDESMEKFDLSGVKYLGSTISKSKLDSLGDDEWGMYGKDSNTDNFEYAGFGKYLYTTYGTSNGEYNLVKKFDPVKNGEELELTFDMYLNSPEPWNAEQNQGRLYLGDASRSTTIDIASVTMNTYGNKISLLGKDGTYQTTTSIPWNSPGRRAKLDAKLTFTKNGSYYDATLKIWNNDGGISKVDGAFPATEVTYTNIMTIDELETLEALYIGSTTSSSDKCRGYNTFGLKNFKLTQSGLAMDTDQAVKIYDGKTTKLGIPYNNVTLIKKTANLIAAAYDKDGILLKATSVSCNIDEGKGELIVDISSLTTLKNADHYKLFLWDGYNTLVPYKDAETISLGA